MVAEPPGVFSIYVSGRDLDRLAVRSGQYFVWRFLTRDGWLRAHPFSISSAPNGSWLRFTVKELGDWSRALQEMTVGTRVFIEGPYGVLTGARRTRRRVLLVAGGIGVRQRDVYICGPVPMMQHVEASLRSLGLPARQIHVERFAY